MNRHRHILVVVACASLLFGWWLWWRTAAVQVPRTFARLEAAIEGGDPGGTLAGLHPDYELANQWPNLLGGAGDPRQLALQGLFVVYRMQAEDPFVFDYDLGPIEALDDGRVAIATTLHLSTRGGRLPFAIDPALQRRFVLERDGWFGRYRIRDHEPIEIVRP